MTRSAVLTADAFSLAARKAWLVSEVQAWCLARLDVAPGAPGIEIRWELLLRQPGGWDARQPWCPGAPVPDHAYAAMCTVTVP